MYRLEVISIIGNVVTAKMIPMEEYRYRDKDGRLIIEYR